MITIDVVDRASARMAAVPEKLRGKIRGRLVVRGNQLMRLILAKLNGGRLHRRSGRLARSIKTVLHETSTSIYMETGSFGGVPYAGIHERGGKTKPHIIRPKNALALHWVNSGGSHFAKVVHHPGSKIPRRSYIASSIWEMRGTLLRDAEQNKRELWP